MTCVFVFSLKTRMCHSSPSVFSAMGIREPGVMLTMLTTFEMTSQTFLHEENKTFLTSHRPPHKSLFLRASDTEFYRDPSTPSSKGLYYWLKDLSHFYLKLFPFPIISVIPLSP